MRGALLLITFSALLIPLQGKARQSSSYRICVYSDHIYCNYWQRLGFCNPRKSFFKTMAVKCKKACGLCGENDCPDNSHCKYWKNMGYCRQESTHYSFMRAYCPATCRMCGCFPQADKMSVCAYWKRAGYCQPKSRHYQYMLKNCQTTCGFCYKPPTTDRRLSTDPSTTREPITTSSPSVTSEPPATPTDPPSTSKPSTISIPSTTDEPSTAWNPSTISEQSTASKSFITSQTTVTTSPTTASTLATTSQSSTPPTNLTAEENACLKAHNDRRALHGAGPLTWDDTLGQHAQAWADHLAATGKVRHDPDLNEEGENLAWFQGHLTADCTNALVGWYDHEEPNYNYEKPGFLPETGHFTQVVWKATTAVGVAKAAVGSGSSKQIFIVARYRPRGNLLRIFKENVGNKRAGGAVTTTTTPSPISMQSTTLLPRTARLTSAENACLKVHNDRRALHGASPLVWDDTLVQHAQVWADHLAATAKMRHDPDLNEEGENLAWFQGHLTADCTDALEGWYDMEEPKYDYENPGFSQEAGHFTQVVWKATKAVGVAQASTGSGFSKQIFIVARYRPGGNFVGMFKENVGEKRSS